MKFEEIKIGMKVVPVNKSVGFGGVGLDRSYVFREAKNMKQPYLFITGFKEDKYHVLLCDTKENTYNGDFFMPEDLIPYEGENV